MRKIDLNNFKVARSKTARDINRRIVLNLIRQREPVSRATLARFSGLQRSTVSAITEELIAERWVMEGAAGRLPRGRRPTFLHLNRDRVGVIGVDIHPGTTTLGVSTIGSNFVAMESIPTGKEPGEFVVRLSRRLLDLMRAHPNSSYEGIGVSLPGRVGPSSGHLTFAPNLGWGEVDLKTPLEKATGLPVGIDNAANACALAELWYGRHAEATRNLVAVTVSEGIGVGMVLNGQLFKGSTGSAGEFGHVSLVRDGPKCTCGNLGCWETLASNTAAIRYYTESTRRGKGNTGCRSDTATLAFSDLLGLASQGDSRACAAVDQMAHYLGLGIAMLITGLDPEVVVVVGDMTRAWARVGPIVETVVRERSFTGAHTRILPTDSGSHPRLRGTVALVLQKHFGAPLIA
jgi:predicted NBD/HSP70 family sugar kinase